MSLLLHHRLLTTEITDKMLYKGFVLSEIKENELYKGRADSFHEYLAQEDVRSDARECMKLYTFFVCELGFRS